MSSSDAPRAASAPRSGSLILWAAILLLAGLLRFHDLAKQSLWIDECFSDLMASWPAADMIRNQLNDSSPPFYYLALGQWSVLFGRSELALRSLSAIMGLGTVLAVLLLGNALLGMRTATIAGFLTALSPMLIYYSQEARMYSMVTFLAALASYFWVRSWQSRKAGYGAAYIVCMILALYTQLYAYFVIAAHVLSRLFFLKRKDLPFLARLTAPPLLVLTPWLIVLGYQLQRNTTPWIKAPTLQTLKNTLVYMSIKSWRLPGVSDNSTLVIGAVCLMMGLAGFGLVHIVASKRQAVIVALLWILPCFVPLLLSAIKPMFHAGRYETIVYPAFFLLVAAGLKWITQRRGWLLALILILISALNATVLYRYYTAFRKSNDKEVFAFLMTRIPSEDPIIITDVCRLCFHYYGDPARRYLTFPVGELGWLPHEAFSYNLGYFRSQWAAVIPAALKQTPAAGSLWVTHDSDLPIFLWLRRALASTLGLPIIHYFEPGDNEVQINTVYQYRVADPAAALDRALRLGAEPD